MYGCYGGAALFGPVYGRCAAVGIIAIAILILIALAVIF